MHQARKRFGQHFLRDQKIIQRIVAAIAPESNQRLIEIGLGPGALMVPVLRKPAPWKPLKSTAISFPSCKTPAKSSVTC